MDDRSRKGLLDTTTLLLLSRIEEPELRPDEPMISTVTLAELTVGPLVAETERERVARQSHLQQAEADFDPLPSDAAAAQSATSAGSSRTAVPQGSRSRTSPWMASTS